MLGFPHIFSDSEEIRKKKNELEDTTEEDPRLNHDLKSVWPSIKHLLKNKSFIFLTLATSCESLATGGFATFLPKFVETQFHLTASQSALYTGIIIIPGIYSMDYVSLYCIIVCIYIYIYIYIYI